MGIPYDEILMDGVIWSKNDEDRENLKIYNSRPSKYRYSDDFCGYIYRFKNKSGTIIYLGQTEDLIARMLSHSHLNEKCYDEVDVVEYFEVDYFYDINKIEESLIREYKPKYNEHFNKGWKKKHSYISFDLDIQWIVLEKEFYPSKVRKKIKKKQDDLISHQKQKEKLRAEARSIKRLELGIYKSDYCTSKVRRFKEFRFFASDFDSFNSIHKDWEEKVNQQLEALNIPTEYDVVHFSLKEYIEWYNKRYSTKSNIEKNTYIHDVKSIPIILCSETHKRDLLIQSAVVYKIIGITKTGKLSKKDVSFYLYKRCNGGLNESLCVELDNRIETVYMYIGFDGKFNYIVSIPSKSYNGSKQFYKRITEKEAYSICSSLDYLKDK